MSKCKDLNEKFDALTNEAKEENAIVRTPEMDKLTKLSDDAVALIKKGEDSDLKAIERMKKDADILFKKMYLTGKMRKMMRKHFPIFNESMNEASVNTVNTVMNDYVKLLEALTKTVKEYQGDKFERRVSSDYASNSKKLTEIGKAIMTATRNTEKLYKDITKIVG